MLDPNASTSPVLGLQASINNMPGFIQWWGWTPGLWFHLASLCQPSSSPAPLQVLLMLQYPDAQFPHLLDGNDALSYEVGVERYPVNNIRTKIELNYKLAFISWLAQSRPSCRDL